MAELHRRLRKRDERGAGLVATFLGAVVFLAFMALAAHTLVSLYATSVVTSVAWDGARQAASASGDSAAVDASEARVRQRLSGFDDLDVSWMSTSSDSIGLRVTAARPALLPPGIAPGATTRIERTVWVRNEAVR